MKASDNEVKHTAHSDTPLREFLPQVGDSLRECSEADTIHGDRLGEGSFRELTHVDILR
jgi:hypothetical protein